MIWWGVKSISNKIKCTYKNTPAMDFVWQITGSAHKVSLSKLWFPKSIVAYKQTNKQDIAYNHIRNTKHCSQVYLAAFSIYEFWVQLSFKIDKYYFNRSCVTHVHLCISYYEHEHYRTATKSSWVVNAILQAMLW